MERNKKGQIKKIYTDEYIKGLLEENKESKISINEIAEREGISKSTLTYRAKKLGYTLSKRRHELDESYFDNIDTDLKAYFLGFIMADGCVSKTCSTNKNPNRLAINISLKDRIILEKFKEELQTSYEICDYMPTETTYGFNEMCRLAINSSKICKSLQQYGIVERKTGKECIPKINAEFIPGFIRGFLDGDGCVTGGNISFCSSYNMIQSLQEVFISWGMTGSLTIKQDKRHDNIYTLCICKKEDKQIFYDKVYKDKLFYLDRKYEKIVR